MLVLLLSTGGFPPRNIPTETSRGCTREPIAWGPVSGLSGPVEDVKSRESNIDVGSWVGESHL